MTSAFPIESSAKVPSASTGRHRVVRNADDEAADDVEYDYEKRCDRVALDEFPRAVHRAVEVGFLLNERALAPRPERIEDAGVNVGIDRHLLTGHRVERKTRGDLGDALRTGRNDDELDDDEHRERDRADDEVPAHDELPEGWDDRADAPFEVALRQDKARR